MTVGQGLKFPYSKGWSEVAKSMSEETRAEMPTTSEETTTAPVEETAAKTTPVETEPEPAGADDGLKVPGLFDFGVALDLLKKGERVARAGWNGKGQYIELQVPTPESKMTLRYIYIKTVNADLVPWLASQTDMLADDWQLVA